MCKHDEEWKTISGKIVQNIFVAQNRQFGTNAERTVVPLIPVTGFPSVEGSWHGLAYLPCKCTPYQNTRGVLLTEELFTAMLLQLQATVPYLDKIDFLKLQNGSDVQGVAVAGVEGEPVTLTEPVTEAIAAGFAEWLLEKKKADASRPLRVSIGHDSRISAQMLKDVVSRGIAGAGLDVVQYGWVDDFSFSSDLILAKVLEPLGAITSGSQFLEPDGLFPNHIPNPEDKAAMKAITQAVLQNKADLGIIFDTDVGRGKAPLFKKGYRNVTDEAIRLVKLLNKLASARASGVGGGSKVLNNLIEGLQEPAVAVELRLKINQNHPDLKGGSFQEYGEAVLKYLETSVDLDPKVQKAPVNYEGAPSDEDAVELGLSVASAVKEFAAMTHLPWTNLSNHFKYNPKFHHEVEFDIWRGHRLRPVCSFWHLNTFETLAFVQFCGSGIVQVTMQSNGTTSPAPGLSLCLCYKSLGYPLPPEYLPNCNIRYVCNSSPGRNMQVPLARI
ncbi:hypothetical protein GH714_008648 [Hevea brasiliensis]|uniref:Alpha-D-phosphohexomutase alpha/beta/alpha domain-containing protein n=1 Tax=Hevea brasiliensis TaxID=3981 RepID=A0A6A6MZI6_HEVBR|nr:hypothetical protein GH714_008648 [Hevea brasiliensis]